MNHEISSQLAHELRAPLAAVIGTIDTLVDTSIRLQQDERNELLAAARSEAEHLLALVERARGRGETLRPVVLAEVARRVLERFPQVEARTYLRMDRTVTAWTDPDRIDQIVTNLLQNIQRYAPEGDVEIGVASRESVVELTCQDSGPGIDDHRGDQIFIQNGNGSAQGLHIGLALSRQMARDLGGDLELVPHTRSGALFRLSLPGARSAFVAATGEPRVRGSRMKLLVEMADSLSGRSMTRVESGLSRIGAELFGASSVHLLLRRGESFVSPSGRGGAFALPTGDSLLSGLESDAWVATDSETSRWWTDLTATPHGVLVKLESGQVEGVLTLGWHGPDRPPADDEAFRALAAIAGLAVERAALTEELANERLLRATVMESLPIAVSIFAGDPPTVIDQNRAELEMLGIAEPGERPADLNSSQREFDVRFADGTPLTVENAPVTEAIRRGRRAGPFFLRVRRADGTEVVTRTYCAPFSSTDRSIAGAVVTSEPISSEPVDRDHADLDTGESA